MSCGCGVLGLWGKGRDGDRGDEGKARKWRGGKWRDELNWGGEGAMEVRENRKKC